MTLPTIHEVTSKYLYGTTTVPTNFADSDLTNTRTGMEIDIDTDTFLNAQSGPGRFVVASNSVMVERFFETGATDYAAGLFDAYRDVQTGIVSMTKEQLN